MARNITLVTFFVVLVHGGTVFGAVNFYEWLERNSYLCESGLNPTIFLTFDESVQFGCDTLCGTPSLTKLACGRNPTDLDSTAPRCFPIEQWCLEGFEVELANFGEKSTTERVEFTTEFRGLVMMNSKDLEMEMDSTEFTVESTLETAPIPEFTMPSTVRTVPTTTITTTTTTASTTTSTPLPTTTTATRRPTTTSSTTTTTNPTTTTTTRRPITTTTTSTTITRTSPTTTKSNFVTDEAAQKVFANAFRERLLNSNSPDCFDGDVACDFWFKTGECEKNPKYMHLVCRKACGRCLPLDSNDLRRRT